MVYHETPECQLSLQFTTFFRKTQGTGAELKRNDCLWLDQELSSDTYSLKKLVGDLRGHGSVLPIWPTKIPT